MKWLQNIKTRPGGTTWVGRGMLWLFLAVLWLVVGAFIAAFAGAKTWRSAAIIVVVGPPIYILVELVIQLGLFPLRYLWIDEKDDGKSEGLATIKRLWRFTLAVAGTGALIALFYLAFYWLPEKF